ncbi:MAG: hypothetical protein WCB02_23755, partial [Bradyrhizobium sp.]
ADQTLGDATLHHALEQPTQGIASLGQQLTDAVNGASFNGTNVLNGSLTSLNFVSGFNATATGGTVNTIAFTTQALYGLATGGTSTSTTSQSTVSDPATMTQLQAQFTADTADTTAVTAGTVTATYGADAIYEDTANQALTIQSLALNGTATTTTYTALDANGNSIAQGGTPTFATASSYAVTTTVVDELDRLVASAIAPLNDGGGIEHIGLGLAGIHLRPSPRCARGGRQNGHFLQSMGRIKAAALAWTFRRLIGPEGQRRAQPPSENLCKLDNKAVENTCSGAPVKALRALLSTEPFELMTPARTAAAPDWSVFELLAATVKFVMAPEPGPYVTSYIAENRSANCLSFAGSCRSEIGMSRESVCAWVLMSPRWLPARDRRWSEPLPGDLDRREFRIHWSPTALRAGSKAQAGRRRSAPPDRSRVAARHSCSSSSGPRSSRPPKPRRRQRN